MIYFIVNPNSGGEKGFNKWKQIERKLEKSGIDYLVKLTEKPRDAISLAGRICETAELPLTIVIVGGDGTFNEVLNGLRISEDVTIGYIPTGSGNDLARELGLSTDPVKALQTVLDCSNVRRIDYGVLTYGEREIINRRFVVSCGIGYDAAVCKVLQESSIRRTLSPFGLQKVGYTGLGALQILESKPSRGYIILDRNKRVEFNDIMFVAVHNGSTEGGGYRFAPQADIDDGLLSVGLVHSADKLKFTKILTAAKGGNHIKYKGVRTYDCRNIKIHTDIPLCIHADGEVLGMQKDIEAHIVEGKLKVIV